MSNATLTLVIPCYNEEATIENCVARVMALKSEKIELEVIVVDDASVDASLSVLKKMTSIYPEIRVLHHEKNKGKGAAIRTGLSHASGEFIGIQDADMEYDPLQYLLMLDPLLEGKADVVYGSRYLRPDTRRVLYFWHTWMNKTLTFISNMFTNLDITDMETCYKLFRKEVIQGIAPNLKEERFGFEPEITAKIAQARCRVYECAISYTPRTYEEGKKIGWRDGVHALYCIMHYSAHTAPLPMQIFIYFLIGLASAIINVFSFSLLLTVKIPLSQAVIMAFVISAIANYFICIGILFRHRIRWSIGGEIIAYVISVTLMGLVDYYSTIGLINLGIGQITAKIWGALVGFAGNFVLRRYIVFPEKLKE